MHALPPPDFSPPPRRRDCPHCGANCWTDEETCWHCARKFAGPPARPRFIQFSLGTLLLVMAALAVAMGSIRSFPLLSVLLLLWILPSILHTYLACRLLRRRVPPVDFHERLDRFGLALVYVCLALLAALAAGWVAMATLWAVLPRNPALRPPAGPAEEFLPAIIGIAVACASLAGGWLFWITLPRQPERSLDTGARSGRQ
jgi:hypothetical protein